MFKELKSLIRVNNTLRHHHPCKILCAFLTHVTLWILVGSIFFRFVGSHTKMVQTPNPPHQILVLKSAICSRLLVLTLTIIWRILVSPYDTSAPLNPPCLSTPNNTPPLPQSRFASAIENGIVWDSVYFVRIAQCGYEYEQSYAFLPLLPFSISFFSRTLFATLLPFLPHRTLLALSAYLINNLAFLLAAVYFYRSDFTS